MLKIKKYSGLQDYSEMLEYQRGLFNSMVEEKLLGRKVAEEHLLLLEHRPVITLGRHALTSNLLLPEATLRARGIDVFYIERGGDVTYHGPGQLVVYPLIDLEAHALGVKDYVDLLEEAVILTLTDYGIEAARVPGATGVWLGKDTPDERKICAIGVKCRRFITMHGLALNVNTDLSSFNLINPCGFTDKGVTSMARELHREVNLDEVADRLTCHFTALLDGN